MNSTAFILIVISHLPNYAGSTMLTRTPLVSMQEFGTSAACEDAKAYIENTILETRKNHNGNPTWSHGMYQHMECKPKG